VKFACPWKIHDGGETAFVVKAKPSAILGTMAGINTSIARHFYTMDVCVSYLVIDCNKEM